MSNLFSTVNYPLVEPETLYIGDRWTWKRTNLTDYPVASYALTYNFRTDASTAFAITASEATDPEEFLVEVASATSAGYSPGLYYWAAFITRSSDSERIQVSNGQTDIKVNRATSASDPRSEARIVLEAIEAVIQARASVDQSSMSIAGRSLSRMTPDELFKYRNEYAYKVRMEIYKQRIRAGQAPGNTVKVKFT